MKRAGPIGLVTVARAITRSTGRPFAYKLDDMPFVPTLRARTLHCPSGAARAGGQG
jgi:hypothetical protein